MWKDDRFLLIFAWPFSICAIWVFAGIWSKDKSSIRSIRILGSILSGLILLCLYLGAPTAEREDAVVQRQLTPTDSQKPTGPDCFDAVTASEDLKTQADIFKLNIEGYASKLGKGDCLRVVPRSSKGGFEHATEIWTVNPKRFYILSINESHWELHPESQECDEDWCRPENEQARRKHFTRLLGEIPPGMHPPFGATAKLLDTNPREFSKIGWQKWHCEMNTPTLYQEFEHGVALGIYRSSRDNADGQITILYNDKTFDIKTPMKNGRVVGGTPCDPDPKNRSP
jgi:hypothetical protein